MKWKWNEIWRTCPLYCHTTRHTHTHAHAGWWKVFSAFSHPGILPQGHPGAVGGQRCGARGPSPSARSWLGQGQDRWASALFACFYCWGSTGGTRVTRGEHANSTQKGPGTSPDMLHHAGLEPTTFLLWGSSATHCATVPPDQYIYNEFHFRQQASVRACVSIYVSIYIYIIWKKLSGCLIGHGGGGGAGCCIILTGGELNLVCM